MLRARSGTTLVELLVTLLVAGVVLGLVTSTAVRQQRLHGDVGRRLMRLEQLRHTGAVLPIDLRAASAIDGDIASGEARDTSLELRATLGSSIVCDAAGSTLVLLSAAADAGLASFADSPREGDSLWVLDESADDERWRALPVHRAWTSERPCLTRSPGPASPLARAAPTLVVEVGRSEADTVPPFTPVRLTRRVRYSFYRAADGKWYLGYRDWNGVSGQYNTIQPVSGPFVSPGAGLGFRYFDGSGAAVPSGATATAAVTRAEIDLRAAGASTLGQAGARTSAIDSSVVVVALRNRW